MSQGYSSLLGFWTGGAGQSGGPPSAGYNSLLGFWTGGAGAGTSGGPIQVPIIPGTPFKRETFTYWKKNQMGRFNRFRSWSGFSR